MRGGERADRERYMRVKRRCRGWVVCIDSTNNVFLQGGGKTSTAIGKTNGNKEASTPTQGRAGQGRAVGRSRSDTKQGRKNVTRVCELRRVTGSVPGGEKPKDGRTRDRGEGEACEKKSGGPKSNRDGTVRARVWVCRRVG